jgi:uncharacterized protein (DUF1015 family)
MATVIPFRGISYNLEKIHDLSTVTTPPYDVISPQEQEAFYLCHPQNIIRLILGKKTDQDTAGDNSHTRAARYFKEWRDQKILVQDASPALYLTGIEFPINGQVMQRFGLIALVRLETFDKGIVLPHEHTFSKIKVEQLELMKACHANLSPIFSLYSGNGVSDILRSAIANKPPDMDFKDDKGHRQTLWRITDSKIHDAVSQAMADKKIYIADGHHRYETALNYRNYIASQTPDFSPDHPANFVLMYLAGMNDPGMVILPAHRMVKQADTAGFLNNAKAFFEISAFGNQAQFLAALQTSPENTIGAVIKDRSEFYLLTPKPGVMDKLFSDELPESLRGLDVSVLTHLILIKILGLNQAQLDDEHLITYSSISDDAVNAAKSGKCDISFILNPTKIEQVRQVAEAGLIMPRKSTYFYPKVITGQVINPLF